MKKIKGLSLFANVGIAETYLKQIGFDVVVANELLPNRAKFYKHCHPKCDIVCGDITKDEIFNEIVKKSKEQNIEFILATPPCQGMSKAGKMDENDPRNILITKVIQAALELKPKLIVIENVPQMLKTFILVKNKPVLIVDYLNDKFSKNYNLYFDVFDAADHGTAQTRKRAIIRIVKKDFAVNLPLNQKRLTVEEKIGDLPSLNAGEKSPISHHNAKVHNKNHILWMSNTPTGKTAMDNLVHYPKKESGEKIRGFKTTYKRIRWDAPAPTITMANGSISSQNNVHPGRLQKNGTYSDARVLTLLELFRLTGLPDDWSMPEDANENLVRQVIGEAVPPQLMLAIFKTIPKKLFE